LKVGRKGEDLAPYKITVAQSKDVKNRINSDKIFQGRLWLKRSWIVNDDDDDDTRFLSDALEVFGLNLVMVFNRTIQSIYLSSGVLYHNSTLELALIRVEFLMFYYFVLILADGLCTISRVGPGVPRE
jgi:hypothetical protein